MKRQKYIQKSLFLDQVRTEVCNNIVKHCMLQDIKDQLPKRVKTPSIKNLF